MVPPPPSCPLPHAGRAGHTHRSFLQPGAQCFLDLSNHGMCILPREIMAQQSSVINQSSSVLVPVTKPLSTKFRPWVPPAVYCLLSLCVWLYMKVWGNPMYPKPPFDFVSLPIQLPINVSLMTPLGTAMGPRYNEGLMGDPDKRLF